MWKIIPIALLQSVTAAAGQVLLKIGLLRMGKFEWKWMFFFRFFVNYPMIACGLCFAGSTVLWMYMLKKFPFSVAYPMVSLSYVLGILAAVFIFHESVPASRWIGMGLIMLGCILVAR